MMHLTEGGRQLLLSIYQIYQLRPKEGNPCLRVLPHMDCKRTQEYSDSKEKS